MSSFTKHYFITHVCFNGSNKKKNHYVAFVADNETKEISEYDPNGHEQEPAKLNHKAEGEEISRLMALGTGTKIIEWSLKPFDAPPHNKNSGCDCGIYAFLFAQLHSSNIPLPHEIDYAKSCDLRNKIKYLLMHRELSNRAHATANKKGL